MEKSDTLVEMAKALSAFQGALRSVPKTSDNPFFHSKYADLDAVWEMCRKPLADNGLALVQTTVVGEGKLWLETLLLHTSGEFISSRYPLTPMREKKDVGWVLSDDPQSIGSAITYARRYAMSAMLGISADEDDDAEAATRKERAKATKPGPSSTPAPTTEGTGSYYCKEHKTGWFKRGRMKNYAHPIGDTKQWCNMPDPKKVSDSLYGESPAEAEEEVPMGDTPTLESAPPATVNVVRPGSTPAALPKNRAQLFDLAWSKYRVKPDGVAAAAGVKLPTDILDTPKDVAAAWGQVQALHGEA